MSAPNGTRDGAAPPLGIATKLAYGLGGLGDSTKTFAFTTFLLFYYTTVLGLSGTLLGLAMAVGLLWDAVVDPLIGHLSDRATFRFGRRHAFMVLGALFCGAAFIGVFNPPGGLSQASLFSWLMVTSLCVRSSNSLFVVPYYALGSELASDPQERASLSGYRAGAVLVGTLAVTASAFTIFLPQASADGLDARYIATNYRSMGLAFGVVIAVTGFVSAFGTLHERSRLPTSHESSRIGLRGNIRGALRHRPFRVLLAATAVSATATTINVALTLHFLTYHARVPSTQPLGWSFGAFYIGALAGVLFWVKAAERFAKHHLYAAGMFGSAVFISSGYWLIGEGRPLGTGNMPAVVALAGFIGFFTIASSVLSPVMITEITALDERTTGRRRDGTFFGINSFSLQLSAGVAVLIAGVLVDRFAGLVAGQAEQSVLTTERLALIASLLPAVLLTAASAIVLRYDLTADRRAAGSDRLPESPASGVSPPTQARLTGQASD